jgi:hypothetical protein
MRHQVLDGWWLPILGFLLEVARRERSGVRVFLVLEFASCKLFSLKTTKEMKIVGS